MNKTKKKIILAAIKLYNEDGLVNVLNQEIADESGISLSNFNYHFGTKKKIVHAVCEYMRITLDKRISENSMLTNEGIGLEISKVYFELQEEFRFFYLDTQNIIKTYPAIKEGMSEQIDISIKIIKNVNYLAIGKGYMKPVSADNPGLYDRLTEQIWMSTHFWLAQWAIRDHTGEVVVKGLEFIFAILYPYLTPSGLEAYQNFIDDYKKNKTT